MGIVTLSRSRSYSFIPYEIVFFIVLDVQVSLVVAKLVVGCKSGEFVYFQGSSLCYSKSNRVVSVKGLIEIKFARAVCLYTETVDFVRTVRNVKCSYWHLYYHWISSRVAVGVYDLHIDISLHIGGYFAGLVQVASEERVGCAKRELVIKDIP